MSISIGNILKSFVEIGMLPGVDNMSLIREFTKYKNNSDNVDHVRFFCCRYNDRLSKNVDRRQTINLKIQNT